jgi:hypothetical protein
MNVQYMLNMPSPAEGHTPHSLIGWNQHVTRWTMLATVALVVAVGYNTL